MKKPLDSELHMLWKALCIAPIDSIQSPYKEHGADSLTFEHKGQNYKIKLSLVKPRKNKIQNKLK